MIAPKNNNGSAVAAKQNAAPAAPTAPQNKMMNLLNHPEIKARLNALLTDKASLNSFVGVMTGLVRTNPKLAQCTEASFLSAMIKCATLKLIPNDTVRQHCWLIPRNNKKTGHLECNWEAGFKGLCELAYRSDEVESIAYAEIYERDYFDVDWGTNTVSHKLPVTGGRFNRGEVEAFWAQWIGKDGAKGKPVIMTMDQMNKHAEQYVENLDSEYSPWNTAFNEMALKTVIKRCLKTAPMSSDDLRNALDEELPANNPAYAVPGTVSAFPTYAPNDPMLASADLFQAQTVDAEYENVPDPTPDPSPAPAAPQPAPAAAQPEPPPEPTFEDEQPRLVKVLKTKVRGSKMDPGVLISRLGMPESMFEKATIEELNRMIKLVNA